MKAIPLWGKLLGGIVLLAVACVVLAFIPTDTVAYAPTPPIDLDGKVTIDRQPAEPLQGHLYLVGVTERRVNLLQRLLLDLTDPTVDFGAVPAGDDGSGPRPRDVASMASAKEVAAGVALDLAGEPVQWNGSGASVDAILPDTDAARLLRRGDIISSVNGTPVDSAVDVKQRVEQLPPGSKVRLVITRAGKELRPVIRTVAPEEGDTTKRSRLGLGMSTIGLEVVLPTKVEIDSGEVVGPSAGLAFALFIYDARSPTDLLRGRHVVVSGALSPDGVVIPVGRMRQKAIAAQRANRDVLLVPAANAAEARAAVEESCGDSGDCVLVVPVRSAAEAVQALEGTDAQLQEAAEQADA